VLIRINLRCEAVEKRTTVGRETLTRMTREWKTFEEFDYVFVFATKVDGVGRGAFHVQQLACQMHRDVHTALATGGGGVFSRSYGKGERVGGGEEEEEEKGPALFASGFAGQER
jgi:hypothetical protein